MSAAKKRPALDLPAVFMETVREYLGRKQVAALTTDQSLSIARLCSEFAGQIGYVIEDDGKVKQISHVPIGLDGD